MCGIFGIIFSENRKDLGQILLEAGRRLTYRGYDSVGVAVFASSAPPAPTDRIILEKDVGEIEKVNRRYNFDTLTGYKGIIQLRWATFGAPSKANAQPHFDCTGRMVGAHNGNIVNTKELIQSFTKKGHIFLGENDGEVVVHAVEDCLHQVNSQANRQASCQAHDMAMSSAIQMAANILKGDYAYVVTAQNSDSMFCVKKYSSLYLGVGEGFVCCSSDLPSIIPLTRRIVSIYDGEYVEFGARDYIVRRLSTGEVVERRSHHVDLDVEQARKDPYPHFMLKEIYEQPEKALALLQFLRESSQTKTFIQSLYFALNPSQQVPLQDPSALAAVLPASLPVSPLAAPTANAGSDLPKASSAATPGDVPFASSRSTTPATFPSALPTPSTPPSKLFLIGSGSSYNACVLGAFYLNKIAGIEAIPTIAGAFREYFGEVDLSRSACILVSQSGETKDVINVLNFLEDKAAPHIFALVNVLGSSLQLRVKHFLPLLSNMEISVPATKTFTNQVLIFLHLAVKLGGYRGRHIPGLEEEILRLPDLIHKTLESTDTACRHMAPLIAGKPYLYYLGYGINYGVCLEGALKMKEITYIPCEAMYSSEFKHGPLAIIDKDDWVIFMATREDTYMTLSHINEVSCRGGNILTISPSEESLRSSSREFIALPTDNYFLSPFLGTIVAQKLAYLVSQEKGINPDQPRNISKTLTVD